MDEKKTAILLYDLFSTYELSVALSVLGQAGKKFTVFCLTEEACSEEGIRVRRDNPLHALVIDQYDSLLLPGCMDPRGIVDDPQIHAFLKQFDLSRHIIACISSAPILLLKAGMLGEHRYVAGLMKEGLLEEGFTMEQMKNMRDVTELRNEDGTITSHMVDGNLLTAVGSDFVQFGIAFGNMLKLTFEPSWYGIK